ncbi:hypothetical protein [Nocardia arthritidis]|uniref:Uncharacterized protein n=1 Tax=Nocardia arthritidis TaxID=228602 RepID=A0A6G9Y7L1_9NOCA|nr:hypothetical protein [Nocardia arthritidis]QIS09245.1 hypothetical protein F5544_06670 [Nocardia arthritidis]
MNKFENRLLGELMIEHGAALATADRTEHRRRSPVRMAGIAVGALALAGVATVVVTTVGNDPQAFAVVRNPDGSVTVSVSDLRAIDDTNAKLAEMGVPARVLPMRKDCPDLDESTVVPLGQHYTLPQQNADGSVTLRPEAAPPGYVMLLGLAGMPGGHRVGLSFTAPVRQPGPACLFLPGTLEQPR